MGTMTLVDVVTLVSALGCGLVAGLLFAFSTAVMRALGTLPPAHGIAAMQAINVVIINPWFLTPFFGTAVACTVVMVASAVHWHDPANLYGLVGGGLYLGGTVLVTMVCNVPRNMSLAALEPTSPDAARLWATYLSTWTAWNHARTVTALMAAAVLMIALRTRL